MDTNALISVLQESLFAIAVFVTFLFIAFIRGRQTITNVILGLYLALLISLKFPYYDTLLSKVDTAKNEAIAMIAVFGAFTTFATLLFTRILPREYAEGKFEGAWKKLLFALAATALVMAYSYHVLPVTELVDPGSPIQTLFAAENRFFFWLLLPLILLFLL